MSGYNKQKINLIKNWTLERCGGAIVICGHIFNDSKGRFSDGTYIHTSRVEFIDFEKGLAKTKNSVYDLDMEGTQYEQSKNTVAFPCVVGDTVFMIDDCDCDPYVIGVKVEYLKTDKFGEWVGIRYPLGIKYSPQIPIEDIGKKIFLTEAEAKQALAKMKGGAE